MMRSSEAETLALKALAFFARDADALLRFLTLSGLTIEDLRVRAGEPELLAGVLDFLLAEETLLAQFAAAENVGLDLVHAARRALPGAAQEI
jgi:hypothetical protein